MRKYGSSFGEYRPKAHDMGMGEEGGEMKIINKSVSERGQSKGHKHKEEMRRHFPKLRV